MHHPLRRRGGKPEVLTLSMNVHQAFIVVDLLPRTNHNNILDLFHQSNDLFLRIWLTNRDHQALSRNKKEGHNPQCQPFRYRSRCNHKYPLQSHQCYNRFNQPPHSYGNHRSHPFQNSFNQLLHLYRNRNQTLRYHQNSFNQLPRSYRNRNHHNHPLQSYQNSFNQLLRSYRNHNHRNQPLRKGFNKPQPRQHSPKKHHKERFQQRLESHQDRSQHDQCGLPTDQQTLTFNYQKTFHCRYSICSFHQLKVILHAYKIFQSQTLILNSGPNKFIDSVFGSYSIWNCLFAD